MRKILLFAVFMLPCLVRGELVTFSPGDPISAAEINQNFSFIKSLVNSSKESASWNESGAYAATVGQQYSALFQVPLDRSYYLTDLSGKVVSSETDCGYFPSIEISGSSLGVISYVDVDATNYETNTGYGTRCAFSVQSTQLETPVKLPPGETVSFKVLMSNGTWSTAYQGTAVALSGFYIVE